jgi:hypothetical protein
MNNAELEEEVGNQISIGFSYPEIIENLKEKSYSKAEIEAAYKKMVREVPSGNESSGLNFKTIFRIILVIAVIVRIIMRLAG